MSNDRPSPSEAHRKLMQMERERDAERLPLPDFRVKHVEPPQLTASERAEELLRTATKNAERLKHRRTVVLSSRDLYRMLKVMPPLSSSSKWIRDAVCEKLDREVPDDGQDDDEQAQDERVAR